MKRAKLVVSIGLCLMLCMNLIPVYGADTAESADVETAVEFIEINDNVDNNVDITDVPGIMPLTPPAGLKASLTSDGDVKIKWNKVYGASEYAVYRSVSKNGEYIIQQKVKNNYYIDKSVYAGEVFYYKISAINSVDKSLNSEMSNSVGYCIKTASPVISTKNSNGNITVSWKKVYGADKYYVYIYSEKSNKYTRIAETTGTTYTHKKAFKNAFLYYKVRGVYTENNKVILGNLSKPSKVLSRYVDPEKKMVALTFDDGPSAHTKAIVDCLFKNNSAATFFVVGNRIDSYKDTVKHTYKMGCELANHSYSHPILTGLTAKQIKSEINKTDNKVKALTGQKTALLRAPGGGYNSTVKKAAGKPLIQWSDDTLDWKTRSKSATVNYVMKNVQDGDIILMHDLHEPTKEAALELIPKLKKKGYQIVTVSELAKYKGYDLKNGTVYFSFR